MLQAGSIPSEVSGFFNLPTPTSLTMALGSTQPLTKMGTRILPGGDGGRKACNRTTATADCDIDLLFNLSAYFN
jgi:hypothetical protein